MKVKALEDFKYLRCDVLGISKKDYRALQAGETVKIDEKVYEKFEQYFAIVKEDDDGDKRNNLRA